MKSTGYLTIQESIVSESEFGGEEEKTIMQKPEGAQSGGGGSFKAQRRLVRVRIERVAFTYAKNKTIIQTKYINGQ